jgi:outer membrane protein OmpA-like peptidoglycan-associated protein
LTAKEPAMKTTPFALSAVLAASLLGACATRPTDPPELTQARATVAQAERDSNVLSYAPLELKKATDALARANALSAKGDTLAEVTSAAYVANTQARAALAVAQAKRDEEAIKTAQVARERARADAQTAQADRAKADASASMADATAARQQASSAQQQADLAQQQAAAARQQAVVAQVTAIDAQQTAAQLQQQLADLQAQNTDRGMLVTLGDVLFEFGRADIKPGARNALSKLAAYLQQHPERRVLIEGFTDSVGSPAANLALSQRRAEAVATAMAQLGVAPERIATRGYGEGYPIANNGTDTNRALNRRVEVYISPADQPVRGRG